MTEQTDPRPHPHLIIVMVAVAVIGGLGVVAAAWVGKSNAEESVATTTTEADTPPTSETEATPQPGPAINCLIDFGSAQVGDPITANCASGNATFLATPDNGSPRANGAAAWWPGMVSGWAGLPEGWTVSAKIRGATGTVLDEWTGSSGGYSPSSPNNDRVVGVEIIAPSAGSLIIKSCFDPCDEMEAAESLVIDLQP